MTERINFCAIDFETACYARASACAIGLAKVRNGAISDTFYSLVRPPTGMDILPQFTAIHGISCTDVAEELTFAELWPEIRKFIDDDRLVAHNASFDRGVLKAALAHYKINAPIPAFECTVVLARRAWPELPNHRLDSLCRHLGIELSHHEALSDAIACANILLEVKKCIDI